MIVRVFNYMVKNESSCKVYNIDLGPMKRTLNGSLQPCWKVYGKIRRGTVKDNNFKISRQVCNESSSSLVCHSDTTRSSAATYLFMHGNPKLFVRDVRNVLQKEPLRYRFNRNKKRMWCWNWVRVHVPLSCISITSIFFFRAHQHLQNSDSPFLPCEI